MLSELFNQLDMTRLALNRNFYANDSDLEETYKEFLKELSKLKELIKELES